MAPLFSKVDLNKFYQDVQNEETLICAKFGKDLFNISKCRQYFDTVGWVLRPVKNRRPYNLYCVGGDVKPCSINQSIIFLKL